MTGLTVGALSLIEVTGCPSLLVNRASSRDIQGYGRPSLVCETRKSALGVVNTTGPAHGWLHLSLPSSSSVLGARNIDSNKYAACSSVRVLAAVAPAEASEVSDDTSVSANEHAEAVPITDRAEANGAAGPHTSVPGGSLSLAALTAPVAEDLLTCNNNLKTIVGARHPMLMSAAEQIFGAGGKRMRPALVFLVSRATAQLAGLKGLRSEHSRLAEITEMIHTASLIHDDVLDDSDFRRGRRTVHQQYGTRVAVLVGDFMFAQSSWYLANLDNLQVIKLISQVIADFANGEIQQAASLFDPDLSLEGYLDKSFFKTASLIAASTKSAAIFSDVGPTVEQEMYEYGRHLGLAFQVVDDILDFTQTSEQLGKPAGSDLASGNLTAPALYTLQGPMGAQLRALIETEFVEDGSLEEAVAIVKRGGGLEMARKLAREEGDLARRSLRSLPEGELRRSLEGMVDYVLDRIF